MTRAGWIRLALIAGALVLLEAACRFGFISRDAVIPPTVMVQGAWHALRSDETRGDLLLTLQTVGLALALSLGAALAGCASSDPALSPIGPQTGAVDTGTYPNLNVPPERAADTMTPEDAAALSASVSFRVSTPRSRPSRW